LRLTSRAIHRLLRHAASGWFQGLYQSTAAAVLRVMVGQRSATGAAVGQAGLRRWQTARPVEDHPDREVLPTPAWGKQLSSATGSIAARPHCLLRARAGCSGPPPHGLSTVTPAVDPEGMQGQHHTIRGFSGPHQGAPAGRPCAAAPPRRGARSAAASRPRCFWALCEEACGMATYGSHLLRRWQRRRPSASAKRFEQAGVTRFGPVSSQLQTAGREHRGHHQLPGGAPVPSEQVASEDDLTPSPGHRNQRSPLAARREARPPETSLTSAADQLLITTRSWLVFLNDQYGH